MVGALDLRAPAGARDAAMLNPFLDTGLRSGELLRLEAGDVHLQDQWLKVMGKGRKERMVPFGSRTTKILQRYHDYLRPDPLREDYLFLFLDGRPMKENALRLIFGRLAARAGVPPGSCPP